jgi:translation elongation factor EF-Tu-like GTPase
LRKLLSFLGVGSERTADNGKSPAGNNPGLPEANPVFLPPANARFVLNIEDAFEIAGRGLAVVGVVERGELSAGTEIEIMARDGTCHKCKVREVAKERTSADRVCLGDNAVLLLDGIAKSDIVIGGKAVS